MADPLARMHDVVVLRDARIPTAEPSVTLSADVYLPANASPGPALVTVLPYRKDAAIGIVLEASLRWMARRGYACVLADFRGTGSSDGAMRPPLVADEVDDGVAAVEWAAGQRWCDGNVGMWGHSYGSIMTMRTASRRPPALKAIVPSMGHLDPERDFVHPYGVRGAQAAIPLWSTDNLANQLLPPLNDFHSVEEQHRWRRRLHEAEPWIVQLFRQAPGDASWREQVVDAPAIEVPALCFAGWRDVFVDGQIRAYEQMGGPKKLVVGPWMHTAPQDSPFEPVGFLSLALRWWEHWLRGVENGVMDEPPVALYVLGSDPGWRTYSCWPPADREVMLSTGADATLTDAAAAGERPAAIGEYRPDPTIGSLSGLWAVVGANGELPLDQHDDDRRALCATSEPLPSDLVLAGRAEVRVTLSEASPPAERLVVRLCDVDPDGRSELVATGVAAGSEHVMLHPIAYRVRAGHRLRVAVGDADFPRLWPLADPPTLQVAAIELAIPIVAREAGAAVEMPPAESSDPDAAVARARADSRWLITREPGRDGVEIVVGMELDSPTGDGRHRLQRRVDCRARVRRESPEAAVIHASSSQVAHLWTGETIEVTVSTRVTANDLWVRGAVVVDGAPVFSRVWGV